MKKEYFDMEIELIVLMQQDIVTASNGVGNEENDVDGDDPYGDF